MDEAYGVTGSVPWYISEVWEYLYFSLKYAIKYRSLGSEEIFGLAKCERVYFHWAEVISKGWDRCEEHSKEFSAKFTKWIPTKWVTTERLIKKCYLWVLRAGFKGFWPPRQVEKIKRRDANDTSRAVKTVTWTLLEPGYHCNSLLLLVVTTVQPDEKHG